MPPKKLPPRLSISTFSSNPSLNPQSIEPSTRRIPLLTIDAHVFFPVSDRGNGPSELKSWHDAVEPLSTRLSVTIDQNNDRNLGFKGFIRIQQQPSWLLHQADLHQWDDELENILRIDKELSGIQPAPPLAQAIWAPLRQGPSVLESYLNRLSNTSIRVCGCCHLIERKSASRNASLTDPEFVKSLQLLGKMGLSIEFMVDGNHERSAREVLDEVLECVSAVRQGQDPKHQTKFVLCQMGMPEMISTQSLVPSSASYSSILSRLFSLSLFSDFHIKLSGLPLILEEDLNRRACDYFVRHKRPCPPPKLEPSTPLAVHTFDEDGQNGFDRQTVAQAESAWREVKKRIKFYLEPILEAFGDHRIVYASGFPYFDVPHVLSPAAQNTGRYEYQYEIFRECLTEFGLENDALDNVFGLNAQRCYGT